MLVVQRFSATGAIDAAFRLYRQHFVPLFLLSLLVAIPSSVLGILQSLIQSSAGGDLFQTGADGTIESANPESAIFMLIVALFFIATLIVAFVAGMFGMAGATRIASQAVLGRTPMLGDALSEAASVFWSLFGATLLMSLAMFAGLIMFVVPGFIIWLGLIFIAPVVVIERTNAVDALGRSWRLTRGRRGKIFGVLVLVALLFGAASGGMVMIGLLTGVLGEGLQQQIIQQLLTQAVSVVAMPVWYVAIVLLYYDARVEHDAFDVEMLARMAEPK